MRLGEPADVYVNNGRIAAIYPADSPAKDPATVIDGAGRRAAAGPVRHAHARGRLELDPADRGRRHQLARHGQRQRLPRAAESATSPRALRSGRTSSPAGYIEGEGPYASRGGFVVNNVEEAKNAVDWYAERGYRQVKLYNSIKPEWAEPIATYAHSRGLRVSGPRARVLALRARRARGLRRAAAHQPDGAELRLRPGHGLAHDPALQPGRASAPARIDLDSQKVRDFIQLLVDHKTVIDATLATFEGTYTQKPGDTDPALAPVADHFPIANQRAWRNNPTDVSGGKLATYRESWQRMIAALRPAARRRASRSSPAPTASRASCCIASSSSTSRRAFRPAK